MVFQLLRSLTFILPKFQTHFQPGSARRVRGGQCSTAPTTCTACPPSICLAEFLTKRPPNRLWSLTGDLLLPLNFTGQEFSSKLSEKVGSAGKKKEWGKLLFTTLISPSSFLRCAWNGYGYGAAEWTSPTGEKKAKRRTETSSKTVETETGSLASLVLSLLSFIAPSCSETS